VTTLERADVGLVAALGGIPVVAVGRGGSDLLVEVGSAGDVAAIVPDIEAVTKLDARGVIITARADLPGTDFVSRCFYPAVGIPEDPVTGSAHCTLAAWWSAKLGLTALVAAQLSSRGGTVKMHVSGDRVLLSGQAVTVLSGELVSVPSRSAA
jgi:PhzF family phenazine biosynthesis protein